jgi:hypothetical protein
MDTALPGQESARLAETTSPLLCVSCLLANLESMRCCIARRCKASVLFPRVARDYRAFMGNTTFYSGEDKGLVVRGSNHRRNPRAEVHDAMQESTRTPDCYAYPRKLL